MTQATSLMLRNHQQAELEFLLAHERALLLSDVGTGKTPVLLRYAQSLISGGAQVLWLTEAGLVRQAMAEAQVWLPASAQPATLDRSGPDSVFIVASHHQIASRAKKLDWLWPDAVIVDEAGVLGCGQDPSSPLYRSLKNMLGRAERSVLATATPVRTAHALDLHALMEAGRIPGTPMRGRLEREIRYREAQTSYGVHRYPTGIGSAGLHLLTDALTEGAIRTTESDLDEALPTVVRSTITVPLSSTDLAAYRKAERRRALDRYWDRQKASRAEAPLVGALVEYLTTGPGRLHDHAVVFTEYHDLVDPIVSALEPLGRPVWKVTGKTSVPQRHRAVISHRQSERGFLVGTEALETGLNLQHSSLLVSVVPTWDPARERQREGRLRRLGSRFPEISCVTIRPNVALEQRKDDRHAAKDAVARRVLDSVRSPVTPGGRRRHNAS